MVAIDRFPLHCGIRQDDGVPCVALHPRLELPRPFVSRQLIGGKERLPRKQDISHQIPKRQAPCVPLRLRQPAAHAARFLPAVSGPTLPQSLRENSALAQQAGTCLIPEIERNAKTGNKRLASSRESGGARRRRLTCRGLTAGFSAARARTADSRCGGDQVPCCARPRRKKREFSPHPYPSDTAGNRSQRLVARRFARETAIRAGARGIPRAGAVSCAAA